MPKSARIGLVLVALAAIGAVVWWATRGPPASKVLMLYGNVDLREVNLPFNDTERVAAVLVQEGDRVKRGQLLARLDTSRLKPEFDGAQAVVAAQQQVVARLLHGNRPEEIAEARANVQVARADAENARAQYRRILALNHSSAGRAVSRQDVDAAKAASDVAQARLVVAQRALALEVAGPRKEDILQAEAQLQADQAQLALARQHLKDADLRAPLDAVVRSRIVEPGEIMSPQQTAFTLAITSPKWVRTYVSEPDLGHLRPGMTAQIFTDAFPGQPFSGWVGFISPVAEFTPKAVETPQLRTSLVYEVRVFVRDPQDRLRLGMPATVRIPVAGSAAPYIDDTHASARAPAPARAPGTAQVPAPPRAPAPIAAPTSPSP